jgi:hypothetical protein
MGEWRYNSTILDLGTRLLAPAALSLGENDPDTHWLRGWMGPRDGMAVEKKKKSLAPARK